MAASNLVTLEEARAYLNIKADADNELLIKLIAASAAFLLAQMNRREGLEHDYQHTKGFIEVPEDIRFACLELVGLRFKEKDRLGEVSKNLGTQTVSYSQKDISDFGRAVIRQYKRVTP